ncbi:MAG: M20/M25/M40 family metallo-hydrolase [Candidatus Aminicenantes bacterium]|nr:M20/M25/M40 family metallo-hydrolase [Candidatus Aminicenantes bacterium]
MARRKKLKSFFLGLLLLGFISFAPAAAPAIPAETPERPLLLKIAPPAEEVIRVVVAAGGTVVQDLRSSLLVSVPAAAVSRLRDEGLTFTSVGSPAPGDSYFLVQSKLPSPLLAQPGNIHCLLLEEGVWLLWTDNPDFRGWLIQPFRLKALRLAGGFPGRSAAMPPRTDEGAAESRARSVSVIQDLVAKVSLERLRTDILALQNFTTRYASTAPCEAAGDFILQRFGQLGLAAAADPFVFEWHYASRNIVAVIPGKAAPEHMVLVCAHYDSTSNYPLVSAPGADDNASGTAAILEMARILAAEKFNLSIGLLCVSAEEWGLYGSAHYAQEARQQGAEIIAVVNLDMIAYPGSRQRVLDVIGNRQSEWLADRFIAVAQPYVGLRLAKVIDASLTWSDHSSFWDQGYAALCGIEDSDNPYYHSTSDTLETLDLAFATEAVQASLAAVAELAQPVTSLAAPTGLQAQSQISASLFASVKTVFLNWQANPDPVAGYHVFRAEKSGGPYLRLTAQPTTGTSFKDSLLASDRNYFYVLTAVDGQGRESNYSGEVRDDENN